MRPDGPVCGPGRTFPDVRSSQKIACTLLLLWIALPPFPAAGQSPSRKMTVLFDFNDSVPAPGNTAKLHAFLKKTVRGEYFLLQGFGCDRGGFENSLIIAEERARNVREILIRKGVPLQNIRIAGEIVFYFGGREENRRVDVSVFNHPGNLEAAWERAERLARRMNDPANRQRQAFLWASRHEDPPFAILPWNKFLRILPAALLAIIAAALIFALIIAYRRFGQKRRLAKHTLAPHEAEALGAIIGPLGYGVTERPPSQLVETAKAGPPAKPDAPVKGVAPAKSDAPVSEGPPAKRDAPVKGVVPVSEGPHVKGVAPAKSDAPMSEGPPVKQDAPVKGVAPAKQDAPVKGVVPVSEGPHMKGVAPAKQDAPVKGVVPVREGPHMKGVAPAKSDVPVREGPPAKKVLRTKQHTPAKKVLRTKQDTTAKKVLRTKQDTTARDRSTEMDGAKSIMPAAEGPSAKEIKRKARRKEMPVRTATAKTQEAAEEDIGWALGSAAALTIKESARRKVMA